MKRVARLPADQAASALQGHDALLHILRRHLPPSTVSLYARPKIADDGMVEWYSDLGGQPIPFSALDEQQAARARRVLDERLASIRQAEANLYVPGANSATDTQSMRALLNRAAQYPRDEQVYVLNGEPVITSWGIPDPPPVAPAATPAAVAAITPAPVTPLPPIPPSPPSEKRKGGWWWLLLLLLLLLLLAALLWWWLNREKEPPAPPADLPVIEEPQFPKVADELPEAPEEVAPIEIEAEEEPEIAEIIAIPPEPEPEPIPEPAPKPPPPPDPAALARQRLERAGRNCSALEALRADATIRSNAALRQQLQDTLMKHCQSQMIAKAREMCPGERPAELAPEMVIVFDASGSMDISLLATPEEIRRAAGTQGLANLLSQAVLGTNAPSTMRRIFREPKRITAARQATSAVVQQLPSDVSAGLVLAERCPNSRAVGFFPASRRQELLGRIQAITPMEGTPLADGIAKAGMMVDGVSREAMILVVSDGEESCGRDPCRVARDLAARKPHLRINVVDILGTGAGNCLAQATGGRVYTANNVQDLQQMTTRAAQDVLLPAHCRR